MAYIYAVDTTRTEVANAIAAASNGDTVVVPAGSSAWGSGITISKAIRVMGAGIGNTVLSGNVEFFTIAPTTDLAIRVSGFDLSRSDSGSTASLIGVDGIAAGLTKIRIDSNKFTNGGRQIFVTGFAYGVIDHNQFLNGNISVGFTGDNNAAWARAIAAGSPNAMFIEDNTFTMNDSALTSLNEPIYMQEGARVVARYNLIDGTGRTADDTFALDVHGNQNWYTGTGDFRGQPIVEFYNNTVNLHHTYRFTHIRSGSILLYNNTFTTVTGSPSVIVLNEEEYWQTSWFTPLDTTWPAEDQINNSFFWNNTLNGSPVTSVSLNSTDPSMIQEDRDYFMHAPQSSGGSESYTGRQGASGRGGDGTLEFTASGANKYYPYTPYTYPHPLTSDTINEPCAPRIGRGRILRWF